MSDNTEQEKNNQAEQPVDESDLSLTEEEEEMLKKKIEELRKRDPFIYR